MPESSDARYVLDHVAFGVANVEGVVACLAGTLGGRPFEAGPGAAFRWWQWRFARDGVIEVIQPDGDEKGFVDRFLAARGPGIHHVTFKVPDLARAALRVRSHGYDVVGYFDAVPSWKELFLHPKQAQGIVVQLAESNPELGSGLPEGFDFPDAPEPAGPPADVTGVRLSAASEARARAQWETLLGGRCTPDGKLLRFSWPDSALDVVVQLDADAPEGPRALELAELPDGLAASQSEAALGTRFVARGSGPVGVG
jgi:methylmalonyl-CoA/ethylmalonyl-CoA epimerase